ncbi:MAG: tRNA pseudouridine(55) synthase TruB [Ruminococcaceae bacterium]|nr:tRNA pseudouridine(55) synthase TruB [Oscillospiraceae bacterium]
MSKLTEPSGVLLIDKPAGMTSHDVVARIRRLYGTRRVGHTGTLDPMATGVLVLLIGRAAKAAEYLTAHDKRYEAVLQLGITTDTEDTSGRILTTCAAIPSVKEVIGLCRSRIGRQLQTPPMYSALKVGGKKLVDLARAGMEIERKPREITLFELNAERTDAPDRYRLSVHCSSGTYIRTVCADLGNALGCGGAMAALRRTAAGNFLIRDCHTLERLEALDTEARLALLLPVESLFADLERLSLPSFYERLCRSGCEIYLKKLKLSHEPGTRLTLYGENGRFFALGEVREYEEGLAVKAIKQFDIDG